jgi:hypothetical protein
MLDRTIFLRKYFFLIDYSFIYNRRNCMHKIIYLQNNCHSTKNIELNLNR